MHAEKLMYQPMLLADSPQTAMPSSMQGPSISISGKGLAAASAALSVLQAAASTGTANAQLLMSGSTGDGMCSAGLPGMLKSWAAETGAAVLTEQQQQLAGSEAVLQLTSSARGGTPAFIEQESR